MILNTIDYVVWFPCYLVQQPDIWIFRFSDYSGKLLLLLMKLVS